MKYSHVMENFESSGDLDQHIPDFEFLEELFLPFMLSDVLIEISSVCILHDNAGIDAAAYHKLLPSRNASLYDMIFGHDIDARIRTSLTAF